MYARMVTCNYVFKSLHVIVNVIVHEYIFIYTVVLIRKLINKHQFNKYNRIILTPPNFKLSIKAIKNLY
jgi:hypothetical protein